MIIDVLLAINLIIDVLHPMRKQDILREIFEVAIITSSICFAGIIRHCIIILAVSRLLCIL